MQPCLALPGSLFLYIWMRWHGSVFAVLPHTRVSRRKPDPSSGLGFSLDLFLYLYKVEWVFFAAAGFENQTRRP